MMLKLQVFVFSALFFTAFIGLVCSLFFSIRPHLNNQSIYSKVLLAVLALSSAVLLFRPHEDTFTGLDNSGYRLMAMAIREGRPLHSVDDTLLKVPRSIRNLFMLLPTMDERNTRDRSFEAISLDACETKPFFYPLLPMCALGFDKVMPFDGIDYFVPLIGWLFFTVVLSVGVAFAGIVGGVASAALLIASPLPVWLLRGFFVESVGSVLVALSLLSWIIRPGFKTQSVWAYMCLGLSVSFHPVMLIPALLIFMLLVLSESETGKKIIAGSIAFAVGFAPLLYMTSSICAPYGRFNLETIRFNITVSASHRISFIFGLLLLFLIMLMVETKSKWMEYLKSEKVQKWGYWLLLGVSFLPLIVMTTLIPEKYKVISGLYEYWKGLQILFTVLIAILTITAYLLSDCKRSRIMIALTIAILPVFIYLKGAEQVGMWSQRRVLPVTLLLIVTLLPVVTNVIYMIIEKSGRFVRPVSIGLILIFLAIGMANAARWPTPYTMRFEKDATKWAGTIRNELSGKLTFIDYYPYSVPFSVYYDSNVLGLCEKGRDGLDPIIAWLKERAKAEDVRIISGYSNPGIEDGLVLTGRQMYRKVFPRIRSKYALPAEPTGKEVLMYVMDAVTVTETNMPMLVKIFDGGPLAVRGPWVLRNIPIKRVGGSELQAQWSREGSALIGPVPKPGESVEITIGAVSGTDLNGGVQKILITLPWSDETTELEFGKEYEEKSVIVKRDLSNDSYKGYTGKYIINAAKPYDPAKEGKKGFPSDLGVLMHIAVIKKK